jgi:hypothetical protein
VSPDRVAIEPDGVVVLLRLATPDGLVSVSPSHTGWAYGPDHRHVDSTAALLDVTGADRWTAAQLAAAWHLSVQQTRRVLQAVPYDRVRRGLGTGAKLYRLADAEQAKASRPGRGARTDLTARRTHNPDQVVP